MMTDNKKTKQEKLCEKIDRAINELVYEKTAIVKAYNYYHAKRDPEQFRHLEENYGIGSPTSVEFVPLVKKHIDVLIGEYLSTPLFPKVSCKDKETLSNIRRDKQLQIYNTVAKELRRHLSNSLYTALQDNAQGQGQAQDARILDEIKRLKEATERNFVSDYEIAGQNMVDWAMMARAIDFSNKRKILLTDLLVSGTCYYKVVPSKAGTNVELVVLNPINTFIDRNPESPYLNKSYRSVIRHHYTKNQILNNYGRKLKPEDLKKIEDMDQYSEMSDTATYIRGYESASGNIDDVSDGILGGFEVTPIMPYERNTSKHYRMFPVYEVEWLETEREGDDFVTYRYEGIRINNNIYITIGKAEHVIRSIDDPTECGLSVNGMFYSDRNGDPFSLVLATANLQDKFDCLHFYRDNVIAESGSVGDWLDVAHLPKFLGSDVTERLIKWKAYKKSGVALFDSSQEGDILNTTFQGFDDTIKKDTIEALDIAILRIEETCSTITGVFREKLGGIQERDAVTNIQVGVTQSSYITKQYYQIMDLMTREILIDLMDIAKIVFKNGISGTIILGKRLNKVFTALPEHFTFTDFDVHITDTTEIKRQQEVITQLTAELTKGGAADPEIIVELATATGLTEMKSDVLNAIRRQKQEANQMQEMDQQMQQMEQQLQEAQKAAEQLQSEVEKLNEAKLQLENEKLDFEKELGWYQARSENNIEKEKLEWEKKRVELEAVQLLDDNKNNDEIKND